MTSSHFDSKRSNNFLDTCAFYPKAESEASCAEKIGKLFHQEKYR
jgi:hypothetical protein